MINRTDLLIVIGFVMTWMWMWDMGRRITRTWGILDKVGALCAKVMMLSVDHDCDKIEQRIKDSCLTDKSDEG